MRAALDILSRVLLGALLGFAVWQGVSNAHQGQAICALRHDLEGRVASSRAFLRTHPHGFPGVPAVTIRKGISDQQRTIRALAPVSC